MNLFFLFTFSMLSFAQMGNTSNLTNAATNTVVAALHTMKKSDVPVDSLSGSCSYRNGSCNGAQISLWDDRKIIY